MAVKKKGKRIPVWRRESGPVASFMQEGARVRVDFTYSPERVAVIKKIPGYRFHAEDKSWTIPLTGLSALLQTSDFPEKNILQGVASPPAHDVLPVDEARALVKRNPFAVPEQALGALGFEVVIRLNSEKRRLKVIPRLNSKAFKVLNKFDGALLAAFEQCFSLPVEKLGGLVKTFRDNGISFAIDLTAGEALASSSDLRAQLIEDPGARSADNFSAALLTPFITMVSGSDARFRPCFFTFEQFKLAFPEAARKNAPKPFEIDELGLLAFAARRATLPFPVWLTTEVEEVLKVKRSEISDRAEALTGVIDDTAAEVLEPPLVWRILPSGRGGLVVNLPASDSRRVVAATRAAEVLDGDVPDSSASVIIEAPDSKLTTFVREIEHALTVLGAPEPPRSKSFAALERDVTERLELRTRCEFYTQSIDFPADSIPGLATEAAARLFPHQRVAVSWLLNTPTAFLGDDMGLGKTLSVLSYFCALKSAQRFEQLLVVCPNSLTRNWAREVTQWFPDLKAMILSGDKEDKAWALRLLTSGSVEHQVLIVNYEGVRLPYVTPELERLAHERKTLLCLDESQRVKNPTSKTFKALSGIAPQAERRVLLSGTPTPKDVTDLWAQMRLLDGGKRFGKSFYKWLASVAELGNEFSDFAVKSFNEPAVEESILRVHEVMLRRKKEAVVDLPEKTFSVREVELSGDQRKRYDEIREGLILRMRATSGEQFVREITNILEEYLRAVQVASNPRLIDPEWKGDPAKFLELDEIVNEIVREHGQKLVIWTNYLGNVRELAERYKELGTAQFSGEVSPADREASVRAFQTTDTPRILVAVPAAGGVGITLTAAQTAVYIDKTWNAEHWMQSVDRIHRIGQTGTVNIISLLSCKVDEIIHWNLRRKEKSQAAVLGDTNEKERGNLKSVPTREELLAALEIS
jgi:SWI/SNF-related matrix-associated actin-dependent regulator 1 of chromatin subfamily A